jgi:hypothetical protein
MTPAIAAHAAAARGSQRKPRGALHAFAGSIGRPGVT